MQTVIDNLKGTADQIQKLFRILLLDHSDINYNASDVVVLAPFVGNYYRELDDSGRQIQSQLLEEYRRYRDILKTLVIDQPQDTLDEFNHADELLMWIIEQNNTQFKTSEEALEKATEALSTQLNLLKRLYDVSSGETTYIPDTNALLFNPDLEAWKFEETQKFVLLLLPTVLSELDSLKIMHRNEDVRKKSEKLIKKIKEYRRRGKLTTGVTVVRDVIRIQAAAIEPNLETSLPWLDSTNNDDRILAAVIEVMRNRPRSPVIVVSRDLNFQNKAELANIPFVEPPNPVHMMQLIQIRIIGKNRWPGKLRKRNSIQFHNAI